MRALSGPIHLTHPFFSPISSNLALWAFYLPTWEEYHTGVLYLGYINGPTEGLLCAIGLMILSGIYGK